MAIVCSLHSATRLLKEAIVILTKLGFRKNVKSRMAIAIVSLTKRGFRKNGKSRMAIICFFLFHVLQSITELTSSTQIQEEIKAMVVFNAMTLSVYYSITRACPTRHCGINDVTLFVMGLRWPLEVYGSILVQLYTRKPGKSWERLTSSSPKADTHSAIYRSFHSKPIALLLLNFQHQGALVRSHFLSFDYFSHVFQVFCIAIADTKLEELLYLSESVRFNLTSFTHASSSKMRLDLEPLGFDVKGSVLIRKAPFDDVDVIQVVALFDDGGGASLISGKYSILVISYEESDRADTTILVIPAVGVLVAGERGNVFSWFPTCKGGHSDSRSGGSGRAREAFTDLAPAGNTGPPETSWDYRDHNQDDSDSSEHNKSVQVESEKEEEEEPVRPTRKKAIGKKALAKRWTDEEEVALARSWLTISENPDVGNAQKRDCFYRKVTDHFHHLMKDNSRTVDQIYSKWNDLNSAMKK
ncbi:hypothetical protein R6Q59_004664 [Mikania micrantha]